MDMDGGGGGGEGGSEDKRMLRLELAAWRSTVRFMDAVELVGVSGEGAEDRVRWKHLIGHGHLLWEQPREGDSSADLLLHF